MTDFVEMKWDYNTNIKHVQFLFTQPFFFPALSFAGIPIVLNLTPSYDKASVWLNNVTAVAEKIKVSADKKKIIVK